MIDPRTIRRRCPRIWRKKVANQDGIWTISYTHPRFRASATARDRKLAEAWAKENRDCLAARL
jgi:hypothetical protein